MKNRFTRRSFLKAGALGAASLGFADLLFSGKPGTLGDILVKLSETPERTGNSVIGLRTPPLPQVRVAVIGLGNRGADHVELVNALCPDKAMLVAICDIRKEKADEALGIINKTRSGQKPVIYAGNADSWKELLDRDDIDLVIIATPWDLHTPMAVHSMKKGKHVAVEVPAAITPDENWELVTTSEETQKHCMMLENVCYGDEELWVLNMVQNGVFGTLTYGEAAYIHDLRELLFSDTYYYDYWRIKENIRRDGNLYPTHGLGPVAWYMDINRGDGFEYLVSMSTIQAGMSAYSKTIDPKDPYFDLKQAKHGDMNNSLVKTAKGRTILVQHDVVSPRPYSRINALAGTLAYHEGYPSRFSVNGQGHGWLSEEKYEEFRKKYRHPIWDRLKNEIEKYGGHGGMDFVMIYRLIDCLNRGVPLDMDVYDAAAWSSVTALSSLSVASGSIPVKFPDFTRGEWKTYRKPGIIEY
jgi:hypothetical protein